MFQSLFLWMTDVDWIRPLIDGCGSGRFQSLFLWMTDVDTFPGCTSSIADQVSILVLVDDGRRPHHAPKLYQGLEFRVNLIGSNRASGPRIGLDLGVQASRARNFGSSESLFS